MANALMQAALEYQAKVIRGLAFLDAEGTVAERQATADSCSAFRAWIDDFRNAKADTTTMQARRRGADLTIEVWRSINANRRMGQI